MRVLTAAVLALALGACATANQSSEIPPGTQDVAVRWIRVAAPEFRFNLSSPAHVAVYFVPLGPTASTGEASPIVAGQYPRGASNIRHSWAYGPTPTRAYPGTYMIVASRAPFTTLRAPSRDPERIIESIVPAQEGNSWDVDVLSVLPEPRTAEASWMAEEHRRLLCNERRQTNPRMPPNALCP